MPALPDGLAVSSSVGYKNEEYMGAQDLSVGVLVYLLEKAGYLTCGKSQSNFPISKWVCSDNEVEKLSLTLAC